MYKQTVLQYFCFVVFCWYHGTCFCKYLHTYLNKLEKGFKIKASVTMVNFQKYGIIMVHVK